MRYENVRPFMKSGDLVAFSYRAPTFSSWYAFKVRMVRAFTSSEYSHIGVVWVPPGGRVFLLEAVVPKVRIYPLSNALEEGEDLYHIPLNCDWPRAEEMALRHVGQDYSQLLAVMAYFKAVDHQENTECALFARDVLRCAGVELGDKATPTEIVRQAQLQGATLTLITKD